MAVRRIGGVVAGFLRVNTFDCITILYRFISAYLFFSLLDPFYL
jgi:hypothetical protein